MPCMYSLSAQTIYNQCKIDQKQKFVSTLAPLPANHTTANVTTTPTKRLEEKSELGEKFSDS